MRKVTATPVLFPSQKVFLSSPFQPTATHLHALPMCFLSGPMEWSDGAVAAAAAASVTDNPSVSQSPELFAIRWGHQSIFLWPYSVQQPPIGFASLSLPCTTTLYNHYPIQSLFHLVSSRTYPDYEDYTLPFHYPLSLSLSLCRLCCAANPGQGDTKDGKINDQSARHVDDEDIDFPQNRRVLFCFSSFPVPAFEIKQDDLIESPDPPLPATNHAHL